MSSKKLYEEALLEVKQLREVAEAAAAASVIKRLQPKIKQMVEAQLLAEEEEHVDENVGSVVAGATLPLGQKADEPVTEDEDLAVGDEESGGFVEFAESLSVAQNDSQFLQNVSESVSRARAYAQKNRSEKLKNSFFSDVDREIKNLKSSYYYLRECYQGNNADSIEQKLETSCALLTAVRESVMKLKTIRENNSEILFKVKGLPDGVNVEDISIDLIDEESGEPVATGAPVDPSATPDASGAPDAAAAPGGDELDLSDLGGTEPEQPTAEGRARKGLKKVMENWDMEETDGMELESDIELEGDDHDEDDEVLEISEAELTKALGGSVREGDGISDFGDGSDEGEPWSDDSLELQETECVDEEETTKPDPQSDLQEARKKMLDAARHLQEVRNTRAAPKARQDYESRVTQYQKAKSALLESKKAAAQKNSANGRVLAETKKANAELARKLSESTLLNAKLVEVSKLFGEPGLSERDRYKIAEKLDEAASPREVKQISGRISAEIAKRKAARSTPIKESKSKSLPQTKPLVKEATEAVEASEAARRWQVLAGIKTGE